LVEKLQVRLPFTRTLWFITLIALLAGASFNPTKLPVNCSEKV
jgi:hypothetical protein